jgi:hypothetical protein
MVLHRWRPFRIGKKSRHSRRTLLRNRSHLPFRISLTGRFLLFRDSPPPRWLEVHPDRSFLYLVLAEDAYAFDDQLSYSTEIRRHLKERERDVLRLLGTAPGLPPMPASRA